MSKKDMSRDPQSLSEVKVEGSGRGGNVPSRKNSEFVYVNSAFVGSVHNVNDSRTSRIPAASAAPITDVYREQYWACSRWPYTQRVLAIAVGVLLGALIGLALSLILKDGNDNPVIGPIFRNSVPD